MNWFPEMPLKDKEYLKIVNFSAFHSKVPLRNSVKSVLIFLNMSNMCFFI